MGWGQIDETRNDDTDLLRRLRDLIRPPMDSNDRDEALRLLDERLAR